MRILKCVFKQLNDIILTPKHEAAYRGQCISSERMNRHTRTHTHTHTRMHARTHALTHARRKYSMYLGIILMGRFFTKKGKKCSYCCQFLLTFTRSRIQGPVVNNNKQDFGFKDFLLRSY